MRAEFAFAAYLFYFVSKCQNEKKSKVQSPKSKVRLFRSLWAARPIGKRCETLRTF